MRNSDIFSFLTPPPKTQNNPQRNSMYVGSYKSSSLYRTSESKKRPRKPIFQKGLSSLNNTVNFTSSKRGNFQDQMISSQQVIVYDFCGCQNQVTPCQIIQQAFLKKVSINEMKKQYSQISQKQDIYLNMNQIRKKTLFKGLPKFYPQLYYTHLNNLLSIIDQDMNWAEFSCLSWIQYHTKIQYVTYFLYQDLKRAFKNKRKFTDNIMNAIWEKDSSMLQAIQSSIITKGYRQIFQKFLSEYYDSVGANLIPVTHYSRFIKLIFKKGNKFLYNFLIIFIEKKTSQLQKGLKLLNYGQSPAYRNYIRSLNWDGMLQQFQQ